MCFLNEKSNTYYRRRYYGLEERKQPSELFSDDRRSFVRLAKPATAGFANRYKTSDRSELVLRLHAMLTSQTNPVGITNTNGRYRNLPFCFIYQAFS